MILIDNFDQVAAQIETERGISKEALVFAVEQALVSACRKRFSDEANLEAKVDLLSGEAKIFQTKKVVKEVTDPILEILLAEAKEIESSAKVGEDISFEVTPTDFGRIAAQTAKQVIIQRIREAEKNVIYKEFKDKVGRIIIGTVQRVENKNYLINLGRAEAILSFKDQIPGEKFLPKEKIRLYVVGIEKNSRGSAIHVSRTNSGLLKELLTMEIPEIQDGIIEIVNISRDPGYRSKVAVRSNNPSIGAVGTCVGPMGGRIQAITKELGKERIDVLEWSADPKLFIASALKPSKISDIVITNEKEKTAIVVVPNDQFSLAIGKGGSNVRLAVRLTGWKLDVLSEEEYGKKENKIREKNHLSIIDRIKLENEKLKKEAQSQQEMDQLETMKSIQDQEELDEKVKVSDLAKVLGMKTKELMEAAEKFGVAVKSVRSTLDPDQVQLIKDNIR